MLSRQPSELLGQQKELRIWKMYFNHCPGRQMRRLTGWDELMNGKELSRLVPLFYTGPYCRAEPSIIISTFILGFFHSTLSVFSQTISETSESIKATLKQATVGSSMHNRRCWSKHHLEQVSRAFLQSVKWSRWNNQASVELSLEGFLARVQ